MSTIMEYIGISDVTCDTSDGEVSFVEFRTLPSHGMEEGWYEQVLRRVKELGFMFVNGFLLRELKQKYLEQYPTYPLVGWGEIAYFMAANDVARFPVQKKTP